MSFIYKYPKKVYKYLTSSNPIEKEDEEWTLSESKNNRCLEIEINQNKMKKNEIKEEEIYSKILEDIDNMSTNSVAQSEAQSETYNHYPGDRSQYPLGTPMQYPFAKVDFQEYTPGQVITASSSKDESAPYFATSGTLSCENIDGVKDGFTSTHNFRMLCNPTDQISKKRVRYTDFETLFIGRLNKWHDGAPNWSGFHIFSRYQTEDDLYVASLRLDGQVTIKKKIKGVYTTLTKGDFGKLDIGEEYYFQFQVEGNTLTYKINGKIVLQTDDSELEWGTTGLRFDYADAVVDYLRVSAI